MKKYIYLFIGIVLSAVLVAALNYSQLVEAYDRSWGLERYQCQTATSSPEYLVNGALGPKATSTCTVSIPRTINADLNIYAIGSSSASILNVEFYDSFDQGTSREWYPHKTYTDTNSTRAWESGALVNTVPLATTSAATDVTTHKINIGTLRAGSLKIEYAVASTTEGNASVYLEVVKENDK